MIKKLFKKNKSRIFVTSAMTALAGIANAFLLGLINQYASEIVDLQMAILSYLAILVTMIGLNILSQYLLTKLSASTVFDVRKNLTEKTSALSYQQLEEAGSHRLYTALTTDIGSVNQLITAIPTIVYNITIVICCLFYLIYLSPLLGAVAAGSIVFSIFITNIAFVKKMEGGMERNRKAQDSLFKCYEGMVKGFSELKFNERRKKNFHSENLKHQSEVSQRLSITVDNYMNILTNWNGGIIFLVIGAVLVIPQLMSGDIQDKVLPFILIFFYMIGPIGVLMGVVRQISGAKIAIDKLNSLNLGKTPTPLLEEATREVTPFRHLKLSGFCYMHHGENGKGFSVGPLNIEINRGEVIFFVGGNGCGKTTAAKMICGLYSSTEGGISLNDEPINEGNFTWFQQYFSAIFADFFLFDEVINKKGLDISNEETSRMLEILGLTGKLSIVDGVFSTKELSQGQRKRLALLLAYFDDSEIYIFDEWAAEQDPESREWFYMEFLPMLRVKGKTSIVITHDDRYFDCADKLIKFEAGSMHIVNKVSLNSEQSILEEVSV